MNRLSRIIVKELTRLQYFLSKGQCVDLGATTVITRMIIIADNFQKIIVFPKKSLYNLPNKR